MAIGIELVDPQQPDSAETAYTVLVAARDSEDKAHGRTMRARRRGSSED